MMTRNVLRFLALGSSLGWLAASPVAAHSPEEALRALRDREPYLELTNRPAPQFALQDPDGRELGLADLRGKLVILNFIYARCTDLCPLHSELIAKIQDQINATLMREQVQFITVATDLEEAAATAELMRAHGNAHRLDPGNWAFLHGGARDRAAGMRLANAYGLEFTPTLTGAQMHGVVTHVIDQNGMLRARVHGLKFQPLHVTQFVNALLYPARHVAGSAAAGAAAGPAQIMVQIALGAGVALFGVGWVVLGWRRRRRRPASGGGQRQANGERRDPECGRDETA
jgi:protein SCO1/2